MGWRLDYADVLLYQRIPAQSATMAFMKGEKLFGVHLNDAVQSKLGAEDGLSFGSVNPRGAYEFIRVLRKFKYDGVIYFDTFPMNEDPVQECERNIKVVKNYWKMAEKDLGNVMLNEARKEHDFLKIEDLVCSTFAVFNISTLSSVWGYKYLRVSSLNHGLLLTRLRRRWQRENQARVRAAKSKRITHCRVSLCPREGNILKLSRRAAEQKCPTTVAINQPWRELCHFLTPKL